MSGSKYHSSSYSFCSGCIGFFFFFFVFKSLITCISNRSADAGMGRWGLGAAWFFPQLSIMEKSMNVLGRVPRPVHLQVKYIYRYEIMNST